MHPDLGVKKTSSKAILWYMLGIKAFVPHRAGKHLSEGRARDSTQLSDQQLERLLKLCAKCHSLSRMMQDYRKSSYEKKFTGV